MKNWTCQCGFPYNGMDSKECGDCGKDKAEDAIVTDHKVVGECKAEGVSIG